MLQTLRHAMLDFSIQNKAMISTTLLNRQGCSAKATNQRRGEEQQTHLDATHNLTGRFKNLKSQEKFLYKTADSYI